MGLGFLGLVAAIYFFIIPILIDRSIDLIPKSFDKEIGEKYLAQYVLFNKIDSAKTKSLSEFAYQLVLENGDNMKFVVVESSTVNAFALPDGTIVVFTGILDKIDSYDELVALIGHEAAHVNGRHGIKMICHDLTGYIFISAILGDVTGIQAIIGDNLNSLQSLSFSREFEKEADEKGLLLMYNNNINPEGMIKLFERLKQEDKLSLPEFLASHPVTDKRILFAKEAIKKGGYQIKTSSRLDSLFIKIKN
jgi:predicted Zn-dependent protease